MILCPSLLFKKNTKHSLIHSLIRQNLYCVTSEADFFFNLIKLLVFKGEKLCMLEFEALYLPFESLFKNSTSDITIYNTPSLPPCHVISWKFYIHAEFLDTKLLVSGFQRIPEQTWMQKYIYGNFPNFNPQAIVNTSCRKNNTLQNSALITRQHFAHAIIDVRNIVEPVHEYFVHFRYQLSHFVHALFINAYWWAKPVPRDLKVILWWVLIDIWVPVLTWVTLFQFVIFTSSFSCLKGTVE